MFLLVACTSKDDNSKLKFNHIKWQVKEEMKYTYRDRMLDDLIANVPLKGMKRDAVLNLLGEPNRTDSSYLFYTVDQKFLVQFFPLSTKTLVIKFKEDGTVEWRKIHGN